MEGVEDLLGQFGAIGCDRSGSPLSYKSMSLFQYYPPSKPNTLTAMSLPPFPEDIPTHPLLVVDYQKLVENDAAEIDKFWHAATTLGFW